MDPISVSIAAHIVTAILCFISAYNLIREGCWRWG